MLSKSRGLTLEEAIQVYKHEGRKIRRAGEELWHEIHD